MVILIRLRKTVYLYECENVLYLLECAGLEILEILQSIVGVVL